MVCSWGGGGSWCAHREGEGHNHFSGSLTDLANLNLLHWNPLNGGPHMS